MTVPPANNVGAGGLLQLVMRASEKTQKEGGAGQSRENSERT